MKHAADKSRIIEDVIKRMIDFIVTGFEQHDFIDRGDEIECLFIKYDSNTAFEPWLYLATAEDAKKAEEDEFPAALYEDFAMKYSNDDMNLPVYIDKDDTNLYESLSDYFSDAYDDAFNEDEPDDMSRYHLLEKELFEIYLNICQQLNKSDRLIAALPVTSSFHVMAKGSRQYNHWEYMYRLLPAQTVKHYEAKLRRFLAREKMSMEEDSKVGLILSCKRFFGRDEIL